MFAARRPATPLPEDYFEEVYDTFAHAAAQSGEIKRYYRLGPEILCLRFAGTALLDALTKAWAHVEAEPAEPALTICCWDSESTGMQMPAPPWPPTAYEAKGHIAGYNDDNIRTIYQPGVNIFHMLNRARGMGVYWVTGAAGLPYWERSFPFRGLLHGWSTPHPLQLAHAGAVGTSKGGVLLTGKSGSGKSTTTLTCLNAPLLYAGDDYVLTAMNPDPYVYSLYSTAKMMPESVDLLPHLKSRISNPAALGTEKAVFYLHDGFPEKLSPGFPVKAVFVPRVTNEKNTRLVAVSPTEGLFALAPTTVMHLEGNERGAFEKMRRFVHALPNFRLELGTDMAQIPEVIASYLEKA